MVRWCVHTADELFIDALLHNVVQHAIVQSSLYNTLQRTTMKKFVFRITHTKGTTALWTIEAYTVGEAWRDLTTPGTRIAKALSIDLLYAEAM
jgi:hypothetical protein